MLTPRPPNIVFLFSDQQRWDTCGCYRTTPAAWEDRRGGRRPIDTTPNLDRLALDGVKFEQAFTCQPVCGPARASIQTGKYAAELGCFVNNRMLPLDEKTLAHRLAGRGYETAYIGKWHLASQGPEGGPDDFRTRAVPPERRGGYDYWLASDVLEFTSHAYDGHMFDAAGKKRLFPKGRYRADVLGDWAIEYLRRPKTRPFFLFVSWIEPHHQNDHRRYEGPRGSKRKFRHFAVPGDLAGTGGDWRREFPDYLGCIHRLDKNIGRIRRELERLGLAENALIVYTSDHGSHFCTRNPEYKRSCHDGCIRIPMVLNGPGFRGGRTIRPLVSLIDLPPTLLQASGVPPPSSMRGRALQPLAQGKTRGWPGEVFLQISEDHIGRAIRTPRWKYEVWVPSREKWSGCRESGAATYHEHHLYDLLKDPHERRDLVASPRHRTVRARLARILKRRMVQAGEKAPRILPAVPPQGPVAK